MGERIYRDIRKEEMADRSDKKCSAPGVDKSQWEEMLALVRQMRTWSVEAEAKHLINLLGEAKLSGTSEAIARLHGI